MIALNFILAITLPLLAGRVVKGLYRRRSMRQLLTLPEADPDTIAQKVSNVLDRPADQEVMAGWITLAGGVVVQIALASAEYGMDAIFSFVAPATTLAVLGMSRLVRDRRLLIAKAREKSAIDAVKYHFEFSSRNITEGVMLGLARTKASKLRMMGTYALSRWGSPWTLQQLLAGTQDEFVNVKGLSKNEFRKADALFDGTEPEKLAHLQRLVSETVYWKRLATSFQTPKENSLPVFAMKSPQPNAIEEKFAHQGDLFHHFPHVYCTNCLTEGEKLVHDEWEYVRCKTCHEANDMLADVREVVGCIGPMPVEPHFNGVLYISLWDHVNAKARAGRIDRMEIVAGESYNYDWAVSASVEAMLNRFPEDDLAIELSIGQGVDLGLNTQNLLRSIRK